MGLADKLKGKINTNAEDTPQTEPGQDKPEEAKTVELQKLKKKELLEIMLRQGEEIDALKAKIEDLEAQLADREIKIKKVGSIAEASLQVTDVFKEAEKAAVIYLENIKKRYE